MKTNKSAETFEAKGTAPALSIKVKNVPDAFKNLPENGNHEKFKSLPYFANIGPEHIQGYTQYQNDNDIQYLFTHNTTGTEGYLLATNSNDGNYVKKIRLEGNKCNHPGGIQAIGQYLFIPCEEEGKSKILIYDIETMAKVKLAEYIDDNGNKSSQFKHEGSCLGITDYEQNGKKYYLLLVGDHQKYYGYRAEIPDNISELVFSPVGYINLTHKGHESKDMNCQGIGLVTDSTDEATYMIGMMSHESGLTYSDWAYLIKITICDDKIGYEKISEKHLENEGGIHGVDGSHFRWGAGIRVKPNGNLVLLATSRNIIAGTKLDTTFWRK